MTAETSWEDTMSAAPAWDDLEPGPDPRTSRSRSVRPAHLRLVSTGETDALEGGVRSVNRGGRAHVRLTRRGRLAITVLVTAAVVALAVTLSSGAFASVPAIQRTVTVSSGQTLSEVAVVQLPQLSVQQGVNELQLANNLTSQDVHAGQVLRIPAAG